MRQFGGPVAASIEAASILTDRSLNAMFSKPGWRIDEIRIGLRDVAVNVKVADAQPFGDLVHFDKGRASEGQPKILLVAPKSGHYATLLRETVLRLLRKPTSTSPTGATPAKCRSRRARSISRIMSTTC